MALNIIHYMHDKYAYESIEMALHDKEVYRTLGCGMSGLSIAADSLSACKYAKVYPIYNKDAKTTPGHEDEYVEGADDDLIVGYRTEGEFPLYGNDDDRADEIAKWVVSTVMGQVKRLPVYRGAVPTQSILTITSNVEYGKATGAFPSGHKKGTPYAPGANPENGMDSHGMLPSMFSVGKIDYNDALDGISLTNTITPDGLGRDEDERIGNLVGILDAGNGHGLYHANINVLRKEQLEDAVEHPEKYPHLTVRVSGYAVGEDGKVGVRGKLVTRSGQAIASALSVGLLSGLGESITRSSEEVTTSITGTQSKRYKNAWMSGMGEGLSDSMDRITDYYLRLADRIFPVLEVDAGRPVDLVFSQGVLLADPSKR